MKQPLRFKDIPTPTVKFTQFPNGAGPCVLMEQELANGNMNKLYLTLTNAKSLSDALSDAVDKAVSTYDEPAGSE